MSDEYYMQQALACAKVAMAKNEVPVGAVMVHQDKIIASGYNQPIAACDPTAHAEINVLRQAAQCLKNYRLIGTTLYVTLEPCAMCVGAMIHARVGRLVFGAYDPKAGAVESACSLLRAEHFNHVIEYTGGVLDDACGALLKHFFKQRR